jgi:hypothetical protein
MNGIPLSEVVLHCQRLALRPTKDAPLQWYGDTVRFMLLDRPYWTTPMRAFETICEQAAAEYGLAYLLHNATIVQAPGEEALNEEALASVNTAFMRMVEGGEEDEESDGGTHEGTPGER